jgi:hypothetical protein
MSELLNRTAVRRETGDNAGELLQAYIATGPALVLNHAVAPSAQPQGAGAGGGVVEPR